MTFANDHFYEGQFSADNFDGVGVYIWSDDRNYTGYW